jgi:hypothetical protein
MWARPEETRERIVELYRSTWELTDATIDELRTIAGSHGEGPLEIRKYGAAPYTSERP